MKFSNILKYHIQDCIRGDLKNPLSIASKFIFLSLKSQKRHEKLPKN